MNAVIEVAGRLLVAQIFVLAGFSKVSGYEGTQAYMQAMGVPVGLLPMVILLELGGGLAFAAGFLTRPLAAALAVFSVIAAVIFHGNSADQMQMIMFMKNIAMAGGLLMWIRHGSDKFSVDAFLKNR
ncbi:MAG TPA: DoxX family protein [Pseudomonadales bacterium]|nr:DoxX family protein [Pseudomonadales bacterium]